MANPIIMHCNYAEQGQTIDQMCDLAASVGYEGIEFRRKRAGEGETPEQYLDAVARAVERTGLEHVLFGGPGCDLMQADADARARDLDEYIAFFRDAAKRFDLSVCNTMAGPLLNTDAAYYEFEKNGSAIATDEQWQWATEGFQTLGDLAAELGFKLAFETHNGYIHDLAAPSRKLIDLIDRPSVGVNMDLGNILLHVEGESTPEAVRICGDRTYMVHLKNFFQLPGATHQNWVQCALGDGIINNREFLECLGNVGFAGPLAIEAPRPGDRQWFARQDLEYLRSLLADLG
jgi:sugar phosphate isomerase/epimerase